MEVEAEKGELLSDIINRVMVFPLPCGGAGYCGGCAIKILRGKVSEPRKEEELTGVLSRGLRLACRTKVLGDAVIKVPKVAPVAAVSGIMPPISPNPPVRPVAEGDDLLPIALPSPSFSYDGLAFRSGGRWIGLAIDLGTTNISGALVDMGKGQTIIEGFERNPQVSKGADIITRMEAALEGEADELRRLAIEGIENLASKLCRSSRLEVKDIAAVSIVGNSVMHALLLNLDVEPLSRAPFNPPLRRWVIGPAKEAGFKLLSKSWLVIPPPIAGFVGSDALSDLLTVETLNIEKPYLLIDLGTNSEVILVYNQGMMAASAPAGSAFESNVPSGIGGVRGAIRRVRIEEGGKIKLDVDGQPIGLAGSGLISVVAEMLRKGMLNPSGRISKELGGKFTLAEKPVKIEITQKDVREIQKAIAAVYSAWKVLLDKAGLDADELRGIYLAGTFGSYLDPSDAIEVGLIPPVDENKVISLGNTALSGAKILLMSKEARNIANKLYSEISHIDLASEPNFTRLFLEGTILGRDKSAEVSKTK